jgi:hypothetical protein
VLGRWKAADAALLPVSNAGPGLALFVGSAAGDSGDRVLAAAGWHTTGVPDLAALPLVWQRTGAGADAVGQRRSR